MNPRRLILPGRFTFLAAALLCTLWSASSFSQEVERLRIGLHDHKTRLVFDLSGPAAYTISPEDSPARVVVTIAAGGLEQLPQIPASVTPINRISASGESETRVLIDLKRTVKTTSFVLEPQGVRGYRLVVDLSELDSDLRNTDATDVQAQASPQPVPPPDRRQPAAKTRAPQSPRESTSISFSGTWEQEWAYETSSSDSQKFEALVHPQITVDFASGAQLVGIARVRLDTVGDLGPSASDPENYSDINGPLYNNEYAELSLRELYYDTDWAGVYWRLGKQQVVWGQADGIPVLDVVNPRSYREFILDEFDDARIPLWMVNAELPLGNDSSLQLLWIPDPTFHELPEIGSPYTLTSPKWVPVIPPGADAVIGSSDNPDNLIRDSNFGARYTAFKGGWDITLNYLYHYQNYPVLYQDQESHNGAETVVISPTYKRNNLIGGTLSNTFDSFTLRAELAYNSDTYHTSTSPSHRGIRKSDELASVIGLDWQYSGSGLLSGQWFMSHLPDHARDIVRDETENTASVLFQQGFANDTWQLSGLGIYSLNDRDSMIQLKLKYWLLSNLELWGGVDVFSGTSHGSFGQFKERDRLVLGFEYGF